MQHHQETASHHHEYHDDSEQRTHGDFDSYLAYKQYKFERKQAHLRAKRHLKEEKEWYKHGGHYSDSDGESDDDHYRHHVHHDDYYWSHHEAP